MKKILFSNLAALILAIIGFFIIGYFSNWYVAFGIFVWTWANNIDIRQKFNIP